MSIDIKSIISQFQIPGKYISAQAFGNGLINDTFVVVFEHENQTIRYICQQINKAVFSNPKQVMHNIQCVTSHVRNKLEQQGFEDIARRVLTLVPTKDGDLYYCDKNENFWRLYLFIEGTSTCETTPTLHQAYEAAKAFGEFQARIADIESSKLFETIPDFHNTPKRFEVLQKACADDVCQRLKTCKSEVQFAEENIEIAQKLAKLHSSGKIPQRIVHNDTKFNNILFDNETNEGICVIDLDTVMPGLSLYDFGDMVRSAMKLAPVNEHMDLFKVLVIGYLTSMRMVLSSDEIELLHFSPVVVTFELGIRYLTDYLLGDIYFKTTHPEQNLEKCRLQFQLVKAIELKEWEMSEIVFHNKYY